MCRFAKEDHICKSRGWVQAVVCTNTDMSLKYGTSRECPYKQQEQCKLYEPIDGVYDKKEPELIEIRTLEDLDELITSIRERLEKGAVTVWIQ